MVIVVKCSDNGAGKKKAHVFLACERGGSYRRWKEKTKVKGANNDDDEEPVKGREMGTKKCECPFLLKRTQLSPTEWALEVKCGTHNHPITSYLEGHSYVGRPSTEEGEFVIDMSKYREKALMNAIATKFLKSQHFLSIKASFSKSVNIAKHKFTSNLYSNLHSVVSHVALEKLFDEIKKVKQPFFYSRECDHVLRKVYSLSCAQEVEEYVYVDKPIHVSVVDAFWRKLDLEPVVIDDVNVDIDNCFEDAVSDITQVYKSYDQEKRLLFFRKMRELAHPGMTNLVEPKPRNTHGRPKTSKKGSDPSSTKCDPIQFEYQESMVGSCSMDEEVMMYDVSETLPSPMFLKKEKLQKQPAIPVQFQSCVVNVKNVMGNGHCGFRTVASLMGFGEDDWPRVRHGLMNELGHNIPLKAVPEQPRSICMALVNDNHFVHVSLGVGHPLPPVDTSWLAYHRAIANGWLTIYEAGQIN
ncbi:hypothetical protein ACS0TY_024860 [Phlomoides rotata]